MSTPSGTDGVVSTSACREVPESTGFGRMCRSIVDTLDGGSAMNVARYVVDAVVLEGRSYREVARAPRRHPRAGRQSSWPGTGKGGTRRSRPGPGRPSGLPPNPRRARGRDRRAPQAAQRARADAGAETIHHLSTRHARGLRSPRSSVCSADRRDRREAALQTMPGTGGPAPAPPSAAGRDQRGGVMNRR
jgi:hypothetical protein